MANYVKQELPNLNGKGEDRSYYRILKRGNVNNEQLIDRICNVGGSSLAVEPSSTSSLPWRRRWHASWQTAIR